MRGRVLIFAVVVALAAPPGTALAQTAGYCTGDGGPQGQATDREHTVLLGDPPLPPGIRAGRVSVGGVSTRVHQAGPAWAEDAVVFVHGSPNSSRDWDDLMASTGKFTRAVS